MLNVADRLGNISQSITDNLVSKLDKDGEFKERDYYGKAFLIALLHFSDDIESEVFQGLVNSIKRQEKTKSFHYEFNRYALSHVFDSKAIDEILESKKYTGTRVANWTMLRALCRVHEGKKLPKISANIEVFLVKMFYACSEAIEDKRKEYTAQYNYFSLALLHEWYLAGGRQFSSSWLRAAVEKCLIQITDEGYSNLIGRGAMQSFGYASLIYLLSFYYHDDRSLKKISVLLNFLESQYDKNGFMPLVLGKQVKEPDAYDGIPDLEKEEFLGWFSYNNLTDYQAFTALMLKKAKNNFSNKSCGVFKLDNKKEPSEESFLEIARSVFMFNSKKYSLIAGVGKKGSTVLNLFSPVMVNKKFIMPPTGGEHSSKSLHNNSDFCFPILKVPGKSPMVIDNVAIVLKGANQVNLVASYGETVQFVRRIKCISDKVVFFDFFYNNFTGDVEVLMSRFVLCAHSHHMLSRKIRSKTEYTTVQQEKYSTIDYSIYDSVKAEIPSKHYFATRSVLEL